MHLFNLSWTRDLSVGVRGERYLRHSGAPAIKPEAGCHSRYGHVLAFPQRTCPAPSTLPSAGRNASQVHGES